MGGEKRHVCGAGASPPYLRGEYGLRLSQMGQSLWSYVGEFGAESGASQIMTFEYCDPNPFIS